MTSAERDVGVVCSVKQGSRAQQIHPGTRKHMTYYLQANANVKSNNASTRRNSRERVKQSFPQNEERRASQDPSKRQPAQRGKARCAVSTIGLIVSAALPLNRPCVCIRIAPAPPSSTPRLVLISFLSIDPITLAIVTPRILFQSQTSHL